MVTDSIWWRVVTRRRITAVLGVASAMVHFVPRCRAVLSMIEMSVRLSIRLPVCLSNPLIAIKRTKLQPKVLYLWSIHVVFWQEERLVGTTPSTWNFGPKLTPSLQKRRFSIYILSYSTSAVTLAKTVQLWLIGSLPRAFQWAYKMNSVRCM